MEEGTVGALAGAARADVRQDRNSSLVRSNQGEVGGAATWENQSTRERSFLI
jgi:hypothetical protein